MDMRGKTVLITGSTDGVGRHVATRLAAEGAKILIHGRSAERAKTLIDEIVVRVEADALDLVIRWAGGDHTPMRVRKNRTGQHRWGTDADVVELVTALARQLPDKAIAPILNRAGKTTGAAMAGPVRGSASCAIIAALRLIVMGSALSVARSRWKRRPKS